jgi:hypothetical protein
MIDLRLQEYLQSISKNRQTDLLPGSGYFFLSMLQEYTPIPIPPSRSAAPIKPSSGEGPLPAGLPESAALDCAPKLTDI